MTAFLIAIEGGDGVGKNTISNTLASALRAEGKRVEVIDFPKYSETLAGAALGTFLNGETKRPVSPKVAGVLYALDRLEYKADIEAAADMNDFIIFDRYIASNIAYQGAKVSPADRADLMDWIASLETEKFGLPLPNLNILLRLEVSRARELVGRKQRRSYTALAHDLHEADDTLQEKLRQNYEYLAETASLSPWLVVDVSLEGTLLSPATICDSIMHSLKESHDR